eukprot:c630_g1_i1 orf=53-796(+)
MADDGAKRAAGERVEVVSSSSRLGFFSTRRVSVRQDEEKKETFPVHRPPLKYPAENRLGSLLFSSAVAGYTCGFLCYFSEVFYKAYAVHSHFLYRPNPTFKHFCYCLAGATKVASLGAPPFALQCGILCGTEFTLERWRGKRDIYNLAMAGGLSFGALHLLSVENVIAVLKKQARFQGRLLVMVAAGVVVGCFGHAAELAFYDISNIFKKPELSPRNLHKEDSNQVSSNGFSKIASMDFNAAEESIC